MGLDMYLYAKRYLWSWDETSEDKTISDEVQKLAKIPSDFQVKEIKIEAAYWRKANQIHQWFVKTVQEGKDDCGYYDVGKQDLIDLRDLCAKVLADRSLAATELPTASGFFFGNTEYDDWYYQDLEQTVERLDKVLALGNEWDFEGTLLTLMERFPEVRVEIEDRVNQCRVAR
jgi:hypothetical protein